MIYNTIYSTTQILDCNYLKEFMPKEWEPGTVLDLPENAEVPRDSDVHWIDDADLMESLIELTLKVQKDAGWDFDITEMETLQLTRYKPGGYYGWHTDTSISIPEDGLVRKLSFSIWLNDPSEYTAGEMDFWVNTPKTSQLVASNYIKTEKGNKGHCVFFPGYIWHRVRPILAGTRYSLVGWCRGPRWR